MPASNRREKHNSDHTNHHSGSLSHKTSYICTIHNKWLSSWNDQKNHSDKQFSLSYTQGRRKIMALKSFVLDLVLIPLSISGTRGCEGCCIFQTLSWTDSINPCRLFSNFVVLLFPNDPFFILFGLFYSLLETPNSCFLPDLRQNGVGRVFERVNIAQENNWQICLNNKAVSKESLHNQKLHRVL